MPVLSARNQTAYESQRPLPLPTPHADPPRAPSPTAGVLKAQAERVCYVAGRESTEARSIARGLLLLALLALAISLFRAGIDRAFFPGWWQQW